MPCAPLQPATRDANHCTREYDPGYDPADKRWMYAPLDGDDDGDGDGGGGGGGDGLVAGALAAI